MNAIHLIPVPASDPPLADAQTLNPEQIERYLAQNPDFLQTRENLLMQMNFLHSSKGTLSLATRQVEVMREKIRSSESALHELHLHAHANEQRAQKIHRMAVGLLRDPQPNSALRSLIAHLIEAFALANALLHLNLGANNAMLRMCPQLADFMHTDKAWPELANITVPTIPRMNNELRELMLQHSLPETASIAVIPLRIYSNNANLTDAPTGTLLLVKREPQGFSPDMGSLFLEQISDLLSAALERYAYAAEQAHMSG